MTKLFLSTGTDDNTGELTKEEFIVQKIHWFGAFMTYIGGIVWMIIHTIISIILSLGTKKGRGLHKQAENPLNGVNNLTSFFPKFLLKIRSHFSQILISRTIFEKKKSSNR